MGEVMYPRLPPHRYDWLEGCGNMLFAICLVTTIVCFVILLSLFATIK